MTPTSWTPARVEALKRLWLEGVSAQQIANALGDPITRSGVLGKVYRLGLSADRPCRTAVHRTARQTARGVGEACEASPSIPARDFAPSESVPLTGRATILTVRRLDCRWPFGEPDTRAFALCGRPISRGAYCAGHAGIAYRPHSETFESLVGLGELC